MASGAIAQINGNGDTISGGNGFSATIVGDGSTANIDSGSGNQISISSGTVWMNSNTGATVNGPGDKITTNSGDVVTVNGSNNPIMEAGNNVVVNANASGDTGDTVTIQGSSDTANVANGNTVNINSGSGNNVNLSSGTVWMNSGAATTVTGSGDNITTSGTDNVALTGSGNTVQAQGDNIGVYSTYSNNISTSGNGDSFTLGAGSWVGIGSGRLDNITMSGTSASSMNGLWMNSNTDATVTGNYDSLLTNAGDTVKMMGSGDSLYADGTTGVVVAGNGAYGTSDSVTVTGDSDVLLADNARADIYSSGAGLNVSVGQNDNVGIHSSGITYTAFDGTDGVWLGGNLSNLLFRGNGETIHADLSGDVATVAGTNILVDSTAAGNTFSVNGQHDTLDASNDTINLAQSTLAYVAGTSDSISAYNNDAIAVSSPTDTVTVNGFVQELVSQTSTGSGLDFFNDLNYAGTSQINWLYNQPNAGGQLTSLDANWTAGGSQNIIYSYSTSGLETGFTVTDTNASGSILGTGSYNASGSLLSITGSYSGYTNFSDAGNAFGAPQVVGKGKHVDVSTIVNFDNSHGNSEAAAAAQSAAAWVGTLETNEPTMSDVAKKHAVFEGGRWNGTTITWSIGRGSGPSPFSGQLGSQYEAIVQQAFAAWGKASGLTFQEVSDAPHADINIGWSKFDPTNSGLIGYTSGGKQGGNLQQGVTIQLEDPTEDQLTAGADGQLVYQGTQANFYGLVMHEIGHALGLADNADPNSVMYYAGGTGTFDGDDLTGVTALYGGMAGNAGPSISMPTAGASSSDVSLLQFVQAVASMSSRTAPVSPQGTTPFDFSHGDPVRPGWITTPPHAHAA